MDCLTILGIILLAAGFILAGIEMVLPGFSSIAFLMAGE